MLAVAGVLTHNRVELLGDEVQVANTGTELHDPGGHVDSQFAPLTKDTVGYLRVAMKLRVPRSHI